MCCPAEVACKGDTKQAGFVYDLQGVTVGEVELGEKVKLFTEVKGENLCLLKVNFHQVPVSKLEEVSQLVLEDRQVRGKGEARQFMQAGCADYRRGRYKYSLKVNSFKQG